MTKRYVSQLFESLAFSEQLSPVHFIGTIIFLTTHSGEIKGSSRSFVKVHAIPVEFFAIPVDLLLF